MTNYRKIWSVFYIVGITGIIIFFLSQPSDNEICVQQYSKEKTVFYNDIVSAKYLDQLNHNSKIIEFKNKKRKINMDWDLSGLYEFIELNDSIVKDSGSYAVKVYRDSLEYIYVIDYGCE
jgi:hypothetical protein